MNENEIVKPITLLKEDFTESLIGLCNNSKLPFFVMEHILKDVYLEVKNLAKKQYDADMAKYVQSMASEQKLEENE